MDGVSGLQSALTYQWAITDEEFRRVNGITSCPHILIALAGPYVCFYGALLADVFIVQPSTVYVYPGGDPHGDDRVHSVVKLSIAVQFASARAMTVVSKSAGAFLSSPSPPPHTTCQRSSLSQGLIFVDCFDCPERRSRRHRHLPTPHGTLFLASLAGKEVLVKLSRSYSEDAHRLLSDHDPPFTCTSVPSSSAGSPWPPLFAT
ncbi:hypothetical protein BV20DRAFT_1055600 [Pilatotrama ljubarskyi]|nr:hypothetical protein BV20DRAFT_1055600 [Pilatotrama ljubarskyi]